MRAFAALGGAGVGDGPRKDDLTMGPAPRPFHQKASTRLGSEREIDRQDGQTRHSKAHRTASATNMVQTIEKDNDARLQHPVAVTEGMFDLHVPSWSWPNMARAAR